MNRDDKILIIMGVIMIAGIIYFGYGLTEITGEAVLTEDFYEYYTTAICDEQNFCQDYKIYCNNGTVIAIVEIEGAFVHHDKDWVDFRSEEEKKLCYGK